MDFQSLLKLVCIESSNCLYYLLPLFVCDKLTGPYHIFSSYIKKGYRCLLWRLFLTLVKLIFCLLFLKFTYVFLINAQKNGSNSSIFVGFVLNMIDSLGCLSKFAYEKDNIQIL